MKGSLLFNTVAMFVIATALGIIGIRVFSDTLYASDVKASGYPIDESGSGSSADSGPQLPPDWGTLFGDPAKLAELAAKGEKDAKVCAACHDLTDADTNKTGPGLHNVVGRTAGTHASFAYSDAMKSFGKEWSYDELDTYLTSPKTLVPGTKMSFAGFPKQEKRIEVIAYLHSISPSAPPIPAPDPTRDPAKAKELAAKGGDAAKDAATNAADTKADAATNTAAPAK